IGGVEVVGDGLQRRRRDDIQQPEQQKKGHHRRDEVGVSDFPCAAVVTARNLLHLFNDDDRRDFVLFGCLSHYTRSSARRGQFVQFFFKLDKARLHIVGQELAGE